MPAVPDFACACLLYKYMEFYEKIHEAPDTGCEAVL